MKRSEQDRLLTEILAGDGAADFRRASLEQSVAALRRRRHRQHTVRAGVVAVLLLVSVLMLLDHPRKEAPAKIARVSPPPPVAVEPQSAAPGIKVISDDELLALFPNRSVGLIGDPGHQTLAFFDEPSEP